MQAHISCSVVMDVAAFKVSHSGRDIAATALQDTRREVKLHMGNGTCACTCTYADAHAHTCTCTYMHMHMHMLCVGSIQRKTHGALPRYTANSEYTTVGENVVQGSKCKRSPSVMTKQSWARAQAVSSWGQWWKCRRRIKMRVLTYCDAKIIMMSTRAATSQYKRAMEEMSKKVQNASTTLCQAKS